ncbi:hypothetical protein SCACP_14590 [Sporomusa carbonis]|uniref:hypothetical protein n=1 Tax=Sporomusa carbonis TaxID=3076075 RepID=UPI003A61B323
MERLNRKQRKQREQRKRRKQRNMWLMLACCCLVASAAYFVGVPGFAAFSSSYRENSQLLMSTGPQEPAQPILPAGYQTNSTLRDPFAVPPEFQPAAVPAAPLPQLNTSSSPERSVVTPPKEPEMPLVLVGVVSGGGHKVAIIKNGNSSRSYQIKDFIGPYQLVSVGESSATLWGAQGKRVLTLER